MLTIVLDILLRAPISDLPHREVVPVVGNGILHLPLIVSAIDGPASDTRGKFPLVKISSESFARYRALCSVSYTPQNSRLLS